MNLNRFYSPLCYDSCIIERTAASAREDGSIRTIEFWENAIITEWINREDLLKKLNLIFPILDKMFPDNWDIEWALNHGGLIPRILIYFPEIEIKNHLLSYSHTIKGLGIVLDFLDYAYYSNTIPYEERLANFKINLTGFRTSKSYVEFINGYQHSHLRTISKLTNPMREANFCLGTSDIYDIFEQLNNCNDTDTYSGIFEMLCFMIISIAETESPEGGPYIRYETLTSTSEERVRTEAIRQSYSNLQSYVKNNEIKLGFDYVFNGSKYIIKENSRFEERIKELLFEANILGVFVSIGKDGYEYLYNSTNSRTREIEDFFENLYPFGEVPYTIIHGRKIYLEIDNPDSEENDIRNYRVASAFLNYAKFNIEKELNENLIRNTVIRAYNKALSERVHY